MNTRKQTDYLYEELVVCSKDAKRVHSLELAVPNWGVKLCPSLVAVIRMLRFVLLPFGRCWIM